MIHDESENGECSARVGPENHGESPPENLAHGNYFDQAIRLLVPCGSRKKIAALFNNKAPYQTIRQWRIGRRSIPLWARHAIKQHTRRYQEAGERIDLLPIGRGLDWRKKKKPGN